VTSVNVDICIFSAHNAFVRMNRCAVAMVFVHLSVWDGRALWSYGAR